jgi:tetratricopeptide (TPR) repeat protein
MFRLTAALLPLLLLAFLEVCLRVMGVGFSSAFFLNERRGGIDVLTDNPRFGHRFFPPSMARTPEPVVISARKSPGTIRVLVFGESAAMGDPEPAFGLPRMLQAMLEESFPSNRFEVINVAMTAINSHVIREIAEDCAGLDADVWVLYIGNNEVVGPFGSGTVFGRQVPSLAFIRLSLWLKEFRFVQWLATRDTAPGAEWGGMEMFLKQQVSRDDPRMATVYAHFERNFRDIIRMGRRAGAVVVASTVAVNLKDCPPFASGELPAAQANTYSNALAASEAGRWSAAAPLWQELAQAQPTFAEAHYQLARAALALGSNSLAAERFQLALDHDRLRFRADSEINRRIRVASEQEGAALVDLPAALAREDTNGIPGHADFYEHVHFTFAGNYRAARAMLPNIVRALGSKLPASLPPPSLERGAERLAWTPWDQAEVLAEILTRLKNPPFTAQFGHAARLASWRSQLDQTRALLTPPEFTRSAEAYRRAIARAPRDWVLRENYSRLLEANGRPAEALEQMRLVADQLPHDIEVLHRLANLLDAAGRSDEAVAHFRRALLRNPRSLELRHGLAMAYANLGQALEAETQYREALRLKPSFTEARINLGLLLARTGRTNEAIAEYRQALAQDTDSAAAHVNLGRLLNATGQRDAALHHYRAALRINPQHAVAHMNLGSLLTTSDPGAAVIHLREALRAQPDFAEAHLALAVQLAKQEATEAETHFQAALRLRASWVDAQFNYGAFLANQRRFAEAQTQFREVLKQQPEHPLARPFLERLQRTSK